MKITMFFFLKNINVLLHLRWVGTEEMKVEETLSQAEEDFTIFVRFDSKPIMTTSTQVCNGDVNTSDTVVFTKSSEPVVTKHYSPAVDNFPAQPTIKKVGYI